MTTIFVPVQFDVGLKIIDFKQLMMQYYGPFVFFLIALLVMGVLSLVLDFVKKDS